MRAGPDTALFDHINASLVCLGAWTDLELEVFVATACLFDLSRAYEADKGTNHLTRKSAIKTKIRLEGRKEGGGEGGREGGMAGRKTSSPLSFSVVENRQQQGKEHEPTNQPTFHA